MAIDKLESMYQKMYTYLADAGIDGVKVCSGASAGMRERISNCATIFQLPVVVKCIKLQWWVLSSHD